MHAQFETPTWQQANYVALSPLSFLKRAEKVYADRPATTCGEITRTWSEVGLRCRSLAAGLAARGVDLGDTVAILAPNGPELLAPSEGLCVGLL